MQQSICGGCAWRPPLSEHRRPSELHREFDEARKWMVGRYGETLARLAK
jgi:hypothetical protein